MADPTTGSVLLGARWYSPTTHQWLTEDPLGLSPDPNPRRYVGNGPTYRTDPSGQALVADSWEQAMAVISRIHTLTGIWLDPPTKTPNGMWIVHPVGRQDPRWNKINWHVENTRTAHAKGLIDDATLLNCHNLEASVLFGSGLNFYVRSGASDILGGNDGALEVIPTDDTAQRFPGWVSRGIGDLATLTTRPRDLDKSWTEAGLEAVIYAMLYNHPKDGPGLIAWAMKVDLQIEPDDLTFDSNGYEFDSTSPPRLRIDDKYLFNTPRPVSYAADRLYVALKRYSDETFVSRFINGAGRAFMSEYTQNDCVDPEFKKWVDEHFAEADARIRLGVNVAAIDRQSAVIQQAGGSAMGILATAAAQKLAGQVLRKIRTKSWRSTNALNDLPANPTRAQLDAATGKNSRQLRKNLGPGVKPGEDAHHIVQSTHGRAAQSAKLMDKYQIDINAAENGIGLKPTGPRPAHHGQGLHSHDAIDAVNRRLQDAVRGVDDWSTGRAKLIEELNNIRKDILDGSFP